MRRQALSDDDVKYILRLIDSKKYSQKEIAEKFHISQGTVSRYNRIKRMQFKLEYSSNLIAKLNKQILKLKSELDIDATEELSVPNSFKEIILRVKGDKIEGYFTTDHYDVVKYIDRHPEYNMYTLVSDKNDAARCRYITSRSRVNTFGYLITEKDLGKLTYKIRLEVLRIDIYDIKEDK